MPARVAVIPPSFIVFYLHINRMGCAFLSFPCGPSEPSGGTMQTRRGLCRQRKRRAEETLRDVDQNKKQRKATPTTDHSGHASADGRDLLDELPDDLVLSIMCKISSSASCSSDLMSLVLTCKRWRELVMNPLVLSKASPGALSRAAKADRWSQSTHEFLRSCADAGNLEACYTLGMIRFYCLQNRSGASLMAKAAMGSHAPALYSLAVIQFNGSGGTKNDKDLRAGVALCARASFLGHIDAMRELGHCLQDGYGVRQSIPEGRRFLVQANARELAVATSDLRSHHWHAHLHLDGSGCPLLSDFGCAIPPPKVHAANQFLIDWFRESGKKPRGGTGAGLRLCSHGGCGRPETRRHEFRRCSVCGSVNYCSRACQALDWKLRHKGECVPMEQWHHEMDGGDAVHAVELHHFGGEDMMIEVDPS